MQVSPDVKPDYERHYLPKGFKIEELNRNYDERLNGWEWPWNPAQVFTISIYFMTVITTCFISFPYVMSELTESHFDKLKYLLIFSLLIFIGVSITTFYYGYVVMNVIPTDPSVIIQRYCKENEIKFDEKQYPTNDNKPLDYICQMC